MKKTYTYLTIAIFLFSCKSDDDNANDKTDIVLNQVASSELIAGSIAVFRNPSGIAPLTAQLKFTTNKVSSCDIKVLGSIPVKKSFNGNNTNKELDILGLYPNTINKVVLTITTDIAFSIDTIPIKTDSIPSLLPTVVIKTALKPLMEPGMNLNTISITDGTMAQPYPLIYDADGNIRWFLIFEGIYSGFVSPVERVENGNLLLETQDLIVEYDMMGRLQKSISIPSGYKSHHDVIKLPNGNYVVAVDNDTSKILLNGNLENTIEDFMLELDGATGQIVEVWDFRQLLDVDRDDVAYNTAAGAGVDWFHQNAVTYSEYDDSFVISGRNQGVIKVGRNNTLKWILAPHKGWGKSGPRGKGPETDPFLLTAINQSGVPYDSLVQIGEQKQPDFDWTWGQHAPLVLPNKNILVFDNGFNRQYMMASYSRAVEYEIDEVNKTVKQVWTYGESRGVETLSTIISDVDLLPKTNNILFAPGIRFGFDYSKIIEIQPFSNTVVFEGTLNFKNQRSTSGGFGQIDLTYRAERLSLYPN